MLLFVDNLTNVDFSYLDKSRGLVGETWFANIRLHGPLDDQGMVCDFGVVKKRIRNWLDDQVDHRLVVPMNSSALNYQCETATASVDWAYASGGKLLCEAPSQAFAFADCDEITPEKLAPWCISQLAQELPDTIERIELTFTPEKIDGAFYHYSHGLKKHDGNCQRIAHGHRSTVNIWRDGERDSQLELALASRWQDIYLGTEEDLQKSVDVNGIEHLVFSYQAPQGQFELTLPAHCCDMLMTDTTVELIASHIAQCLKAENPQSSFVVQAFEGAGKGAIAQC